MSKCCGVGCKSERVNLIDSVRQFTEAVGCTTDRYNVRQTALYIGLQLEEMAEKLEAVLGICSQANDLHELSGYFKSGEYDDCIEVADRAAMLDADIDLAWVTIGSALSQGADVEGAAGEVARANLSKLVACHCTNRGYVEPACNSCNGLGLVAIKDSNGKVVKPSSFVPPNIEPFVCVSTGA